jgi:membrane glycosyltransferase
MLVTGAMAYASAPLWLASVLLGAAVWAFSGHGGFRFDQGLPVEMIALWTATVAMLALPRALGVAAIVAKGEQQAYGGTGALIRGALVEGGLSMLQAPVRMIAHSMFVVVALTGLKLDWKSPPREAASVTWRDAARNFGLIAAIVSVLMVAATAFAPETALWLAPVALPLLLAIPLSVMTSRPRFGQRVRSLNLLVTPEETSTPMVLRNAWAHAERAAPAPAWHDVVRDPWLFNVVRRAMGPRNTTRGSRGAERGRLVRRLAAAQNTEATTPLERMRFLSEPQAIVWLRDELAANSEFGAEAASEADAPDAVSSSPRLRLA